MPRPKVFVSYSHRDTEALQQLLRFLRSLEREGLLAAWADTTLQGGDDWEQKIDEALAEAKVGVLLISQDFLDSSFITQKEVPRLLARAATGVLRIIPVFLSPSTVDEIGFADPLGGGRKIFLTKFQGYGSPDQPLSDREWSERERLYRDLARQIQALAGAGLVPGALPAATEARRVAVTVPAGPTRAFELTSLPRPKVFVSYSHRNEGELKQILRFLRPLEREGLLAAWADTALQAGDNWEQKIEEALAAATVAVLLISQDFLDSSFITRQEVPRLLEREATNALRVIPVFLSPSLVNETGFADPRSGNQIRLSKFQGYGSPDKPLSVLEWSKRERLYRDLARQIQALSGADLLPGALPAATEAPKVAVTDPAGPTRAFELTIQLEDRGETLLVTYHLPGRKPLGSATIPWVEVQKRIEPLHQTLDEASNLTLLPYLGSRKGCWGDVLFDILFGTVEQWEPVFRTVFGRPTGPRPNPTLESVRLRIHAVDSRLSGLPWRLTSWEGQPLLDSGWTFTTTHVLDPGEDQLTTVPANVLVVAPQNGGAGGGPHQQEHWRAILDVLAKAWPTGRNPGYVQIARTRAELEQGIRSLRPTIIYVYGRGTVGGGRPSLLLGGERGPEPMTLAELRRLFATVGYTPSVVYLNTEGLTHPDGEATPDRIFGAQVPLLLWRRRPEWDQDSTTTAVQWLHRWLVQGEDPVAALHQIHRDIDRPSCEACTLAIHSGYRTWRTKAYWAGPRQHYPLLRLNRDHQKSLVRKHLEELVRSGNHRVMSLVPYAAPGHSLPYLWEQLRHDLELSLSHLAEIRWLRLQLPAVRASFRRDLEEELKLQLNAGPNETVRSLLHRHAPRAVGPDRKPVLWLAWEGCAAPRLAAEPLADWLRFSSEFLVAHCPDDLRLVSYLPQEVPAEEHNDFARRLQEQRHQHRMPGFRLTDLPPLGKVATADLLNLLEEPDFSSCDPSIRSEVAERIISKTGGLFGETVSLFEEAESGSWYDLLARLRRDQSALHDNRFESYCPAADVAAPTASVVAPSPSSSHLPGMAEWDVDEVELSQDDLEQVIAVYQKTLQALDRLAQPTEWAQALVHLGSVYVQRRIGDRRESIEYAIECFRQALKILTREAMPDDWARTKILLATAYSERDNLDGHKETATPHGLADDQCKVFISYAREDAFFAERLFAELKEAGFRPWLDKEFLLPGQHWAKAIEDAIGDSRCFLVLLSSRALVKRGFFQKEIRKALDILDQIPESDIFLIPARLNECEPQNPAMRAVQWVDLFPDWDSGVQKICNVLRLVSGA